ncbi:cupin domain-containing protein [Clostridium fermenticellae]|uniref:Cupin domain-containing protein n=1 Tax=Clostridium fermenticellae TaxID=2068654 RepID=A0A386H2I3_9CLOT|nr:cupin domain-containing protein [Clostridium fermenticellae]AYD39864.1 cupin domain-containing protein [Clostridium fermenticellae]
MIIKSNEVKLKNIDDGISKKVISHGGSLMGVEFHFLRGAVKGIHFHKNEQLSYILKGSFEVQLEGKKEILRVGDSCYVKSNASHGILALEDSIVLNVFTPQVNAIY